MKGKILSIQWLRGIAAISVVIFHASLRTGDALLVGGVDVFFVISGYIMWTISGRAEAPATFMVRRIARILPLYWIATGIMAVGALAGLFPSVTLTGRHVIASLLFLPHVSPSNGQVWPLVVQGWTLNYEMFFYALVALTLLAPRVLQPGLLTAALAGLASLGAVLVLPGVAERFYTDPVLLEFAGGVLLARFQRPLLGRGRLAGIALIATGTASFAAGWLLDLSQPRLLVWGLPALLLVAGCISLEKANVSFDWRPAVFLGDASYAIALFHAFAISVVARLLDFAAHPLFAMSTATVAGLALGAAVHVIVERRIQGVLRPGRLELPLAAPPARARAGNLRD
jgi:exopolysaccharide production protein ExoZ